MPEEYGRLIGRLKIKNVSTESPDYLERINCLRQDIDKIDHEILELMGRRMDNSKKIALHKMKNNISIFQPARWDEIIKTRIEEGRDKELSEEFITKLYQFIHEESIRLQEQVLND